MAISKDKKQQLVADLTALLEDAKMTVYAQYQGLSVADLQDLRRLARESGVKIKIVKNRLMKVALGSIAVYKNVDTAGLEGQLLYAASSADEVAPAQVLDKFASTHETLNLKGAFDGAGQNLSEAAVKSLAKLPSKEQLIAEVVAQLLSPITESISGLSGGLSGILSGLEVKASA